MSLYKLITPKAFIELVKNETSRRIVPIDSSWYLPNLNRDAKKEFLNEERIPKSVYFDIDAVKDMKSPYPHMAPDLATFNQGMSSLGITKDDILVVYDRIGNFSAPRCAWTLSMFGHTPVYLLNNYILYKRAGYALDTTKRTKLSEYLPSNYKADVNLCSENVISYEEMLDLVKSGNLGQRYNVYDARALPRFEGRAPEPRPGLPSGHIPGTQPLPYVNVLDSDSNAFPDNPDDMKAKLEETFTKLKDTFDPAKPTVVMCGTGVSGCIIMKALEHAGIKDVKLYDGSWTEWALRADHSLIAKGRDVA